MGDQLDCLDTQNKWYLSTVLRRSDDGRAVLIGYNGWSPKWNEWVLLSSLRLAPAGKRSHGAVGPLGSRVSGDVLVLQRALRDSEVELRRLGL